jgi:hypothetical protein
MEYDFLHSFSAMGYFRLQGHDEELPGILSYEAGGEIILDVFGTLIKFEDLINNVDYPDVVHGYLEGCSKVSLLGIQVMETKYGTIATSKIFCRYAIFFAYVDTCEKKFTSKIIISIPEMSFWCPPDTIDLLPSSETGIKLKREREKLKNGKIKIGDDTSLSLYAGYNFHGNYLALDVSLRQSTDIVLSSTDNFSLDKIKYFIDAFESFMTFAALKTCLTSKIAFYDKGNDKVIGHIIISRRGGPTIISPIKPNHNFLFVYKDIENEFPEIINKWINAESSIKPIRRHLIDSVKQDSPFSSTDFLILVNALEGYHRRFIDKNKKDLDIRLNELIQRYLIVGIDIIGFDTKKVARTRNYYSHLMANETYGDIIDNIYDLYQVSIRLSSLLMCCIMENVGFDIEIISFLMKRRRQGLKTKH